MSSISRRVKQTNMDTNVSNWLIFKAAKSAVKVVIKSAVRLIKIEASYGQRSALLRLPDTSRVVCWPRSNKLYAICRDFLRLGLASDYIIESGNVSPYIFYQNLRVFISNAGQLKCHNQNISRYIVLNESKGDNISERPLVDRSTF